MKKLNNHINSEFNANSELSFDGELEKKHREELGLGLPEGYFSKSKINILEKVSIKKGVKLKYFTRQRLIWSVAATITLLVALTVFKPNVLPSINEIPAIVSDTINTIKSNSLVFDNSAQDEDTVFIASLFVEDSQIDEFVNNYVMEELVYNEILEN